MRLHTLTPGSTSRLITPKPIRLSSTALGRNPLVAAFSRLGATLIVGVCVLLLVGLAGLTILGQSLLSFRHTEAKQTWQQQQVQHYEVEVAWRSPSGHGHVRAEIRDNQIVGGVDLDTGNSLVPLNLQHAGYGANYFMKVDNLFNLIDAQIQPAPNWRTRVARYHPLLARVLDPCAAPLPRVSYDGTWGYPQSIHYSGSPCRAQGQGEVIITQFQPLSVE